MAGWPVPLLKWVYAIYLNLTRLKGVSSMKLHRDLGVTQNTLQWFVQGVAPGDGPVYTDGSTAYDGLPNREACSVREHVSGKAHVNGVESF